MLPDQFYAPHSSDPLGRHYTATWVGKILTEIMEVNSPDTVLELGSGSGALAAAARERWQKSNLVTVDIDPNAVTNLSDRKSTVNHTHHVHNALDASLSELIGLRLHSVDAAICNPPYTRARWHKNWKTLLIDTGLDEAFPKFQDVGTDVLFTAQNIRFLKDKGKLGLILPDGIVAGERHCGVRRVLLRDHRIDEIIQLPKRVFTGTEAQAHLVVLSKAQGPTQEIPLRQLYAHGEFSSPVTIDSDQGVNRMDYQHYSLDAIHTKCEMTVPLGRFVNSLCRGRIMSSQVKTSGFPVFHLGDFPCSNRRSFVADESMLASPEMANNPQFASQMATSGDILVARVGRNHHQKVCHIQQGTFLISDCVFRLRIKEPFRSIIIDFLLSKVGMDLLSTASHGVGAKHLSQTNLLTIPLPSRIFNEI